MCSLLKKRTVIFLFLLPAFSSAIYSQNVTISGRVLDTSNHEFISSSSIALIKLEDSILVRYTWTDSIGKFRLENINSGKYILIVSHPNYPDYVDAIVTKNEANLLLPDIVLSTKEHLLEEVVVRQTVSAIKIKGDTTEYIADSFKVQPNSTVEELLRKLPGMQVDKFGVITFQGKKVKKVLVDGEEFFGDDPTLITQNIRADMVDKVQAYDKKSEQAAFSGINDGIKDKTINIKLKANKKNGYFGKVNGGAGSSGYFDNQAMINLFRDKMKFASYAIISNTGVGGLGWKDQQNYGDVANSGVQIGDAGDLSISISNDDEGINSWSGNYDGRGLPLVQTGGLHFNNKWDDDKQSINTNYKTSNLNIKGNSKTVFQNNLPGLKNFGNQSESFSGLNFRNKLNGTYDLEIDSFSSVKISFDGSTGHKTTTNSYESETFGEDSLLISDNTREIKGRGDNRTLISSILWRKKFKKAGRTISISFNENYVLNDINGFLYSKTFFKKIDSISVIDQKKISNTSGFNFTSKAIYTEPLSTSSSLAINYGIIVNNIKSRRKTFDKSTRGDYSILNEEFSNNYQYKQYTYLPGVSYNYSSKKWLINFGSNIGITSYKQDDIDIDTSIRRNFINWYPRAMLAYSFSTQRRLSINYKGNSQQPLINQLQPVIVNEDPFNLVVGNPGLNPSFRNNFQVTFNDNKDVAQRYFYATISYSFTRNGITNYTTTDTLTSITTSQFVNINGNKNLTLYSSYDFSLKKPDLNISLNLNTNFNNYVNYVNGILSKNRSAFYSGGIYVGKTKVEKYDLRIDLTGGYNTSKSNLEAAGIVKYWTYNLHPSLIVFLPFKMQLQSDLNYNFQQKSLIFDNNIRRAIWNVGISKKLMKKDNLKFTLSCNDILNQNIGILRNINTNYITQNTFTTIRRYILLSGTLNFNKSKN
ncbi:outer membrane beta-barrel protein [Parafilimonas sp.]|uniref:outer membrane beta-barrel protein n=1 Tax=Parafilimonas sp. TaxID=1969739 RepID=UPI003F813A2A